MLTPPENYFARPDWSEEDTPGLRGGSAMDVRHNTARQIARIWIAISLAAIVLIFVPGIAGMDGLKGGYALSFLAAFLAILGIVAVIMFYQLAKRIDSLTKAENILAHWTYPTQLWKEYTKLEFAEDSTDKRNLFLLISVTAIVVGLGLWMGLRSDGVVIAYIITGIIFMVGITAMLTGWYNYHQNRKQVGEALITRDGASLNRQIHIWKGLGTRLEHISYEDTKWPIPIIKIEYSAPAKTQRNSYTARIPVPPGQEETARKVVLEIAAAHLKASRIRD
jgi:hypothetical protein